MSNATPSTIDTSTAAALDVALDRLGEERRPAFAYDAHGNVCGIVYYGDEAARWYAVDLQAALLLSRMPEDVDGLGPRARALYEAWCEATTPVGEGERADDALLVAEAFTGSRWSLMRGV